VHFLFFSILFLNYVYVRFHSKCIELKTVSGHPVPLHQHECNGLARPAVRYWHGTYIETDNRRDSGHGENVIPLLQAIVRILLERH